MSGTAQATTAAAKQQNIAATNAALRKQFTNGSMFVKKTLPQQAINLQGITAISLSNQGALVGIDLEITLQYKNTGATTAAANPGCPYNFFSNINFVDQSNVTRHNLSMQGLYDYLNLRGGMRTGSPFDTASVYAEGGGTYPNIADPLVPLSIATTVTSAITFMIHVPISRSKLDTTGMVLLQTGNQNQPAVLNLTLSPYIGQLGGNAPYTLAGAVQSGVVTPHQLYWQPQTGAIAPPIDTQVQWTLFETGPDSTNLSVGMVKQVLFQMQYKTYAVGVRYYNGSTFSVGGGDMSSVIEKTLGGTFYIDDDSPLMRFRRYRIARGFENAPGLYWFDYASKPLQFNAVGIYEADFVPATVNAGAYMTSVYDWLKIPSQLSMLPGGSQIS